MGRNKFSVYLRRTSRRTDKWGEGGGRGAELRPRNDGPNSAKIISGALARPDAYFSTPAFAVAASDKRGEIHITTRQRSEF